MLKKQPGLNALENDTLYLEDISGRVSISGEIIPKFELVSGIIIGLMGKVKEL